MSADSLLSPEELARIRAAERVASIRRQLRESTDPERCRQLAVEAHTFAKPGRAAHLADAIDAYETAAALDGKPARSVALRNMVVSALRALPVTP